MKQYAPYLRINDQPIEIGTRYWIVDKSSLKISEYCAGNENNITYGLYFLDYDDALEYQLTHSKTLSLFDVIKAIPGSRYPELEKALMKSIREHHTLKKYNESDVELTTTLYKNRKTYKY